MKRGYWLFLGLLTATAPAQTVSVSSLLDQMPSLDWLTSRPQPYFRAAQASSYDRASTDPKDAKNWFANGDLGKYVRIEEKNGRKEYVMADLTGPGAVVRIWSANPMGTIRFYFDGEASPRLEAKMADLLTGKVSPYGDPLAYMAAQGVNLYFPFPYAKSLKITAENDKPEWPSLYYHIGYRIYEQGTKVETFDPAKLPIGEIAIIRSELASGARVEAQKTDSVTTKGQSAWRGYSKSLTSKSGAVLQKLQVKIPFPLVQTVKAMDWNDPHQPHNVLRNTMLRISCDGERTVEVPLGDFFATAPGINEAKSLPITVSKDGTMTSYWPMPFLKRMDIAILPPKGINVPLQVNLAWSEKKFTPQTYYFRAVWNVDIGHTRPMRDMKFLSTEGEGVFVGTHLHVTNPTPAWWGEGDEKVYVDNEAFPSTFGTGTEDYFGYAWCSPQLFTRPYHGQSRCDGPGNFGQTSVRRFQTFDPITFTKSFKFDVEMWHWAEVSARFARVSYWYSRPGSKLTADPIKPSDLLVVQTLPPAPVKGAIEMETLKPALTGGVVEVQEGFWELSAGKQLWWMDSKEGDKLTVRVPVKTAGRFNVIGHFCHAKDYGKHSIRILDASGKELAPAKEFDFYLSGIKWTKESLGTVDLPAGEVILEVTNKGRNPKAEPRHMLGLDYLLLEPK